MTSKTSTQKSVCQLQPFQDFVLPYTLSISINGVSINLFALVDTGSPLSQLESTIVLYVSGNEPLKCDLDTVNGFKHNIVDKFTLIPTKTN